MSADHAAALRSLPSVDELLRRLADRDDLSGLARPHLTALVREALDHERARILRDHTAPVRARMAFHALSMSGS